MASENNTRRPPTNPSSEPRFGRFVSWFSQAARASAVVAFWLVVVVASLAGVAIAMRAIWWAFELTTRTFGI